MSTSSNSVHLCQLVLDNETYMHLEKHNGEVFSTVDPYQKHKLHCKRHSAVTLDSRDLFVKNPHRKMLALRRGLLALRFSSLSIENTEISPSKQFLKPRKTNEQIVERHRHVQVPWYCTSWFRITLWGYRPFRRMPKGLQYNVRDVYMMGPYQF